MLAQEKPLVLLHGATASGKSSRALAWARAHDGVIINADSMQIYAQAPILTAQPDADAMQCAPHRLYGVLDAGDACSVARWVEMAVREVRACWATGRLPMLVGGTGMYLRAFTHGLAPVPDIDVAIRQEVRACSTEALAAALQREDPVMSARLNAGDTQRMARALEVKRATGISLDAWQQRPNIIPLPEARVMLYVQAMPREVLYGRINARVCEMVSGGGMKEARLLHAVGYERSLPLLRAVGVAQLLAHLDGLCSEAEAVEAMQTATRRYAKRQMTWARNQWPEAPEAPERLS